MEIKREVTINGCRDCPDLADVEVGQIEAGLELEIGVVRARARTPGPKARAQGPGTQGPRTHKHTTEINPGRRQARTFTMHHTKAKSNAISLNIGSSAGRDGRI